MLPMSSATPVTDPDLLRRLEEQSQPLRIEITPMQEEQEVTDPALLEKLQTIQSGGDPTVVTDPELIKQLEYKANINPETGVSTAVDTDEELKKLGFFDSMSYAFRDTRSFTQNSGDFLESYVPLGRIDIAGPEDGGVPISLTAALGGKGLRYFSPEETYGPDFMGMSPEERRRRMEEARLQYVEEQFPEVTNLTEFNWAGETTGTLARVLADPTTLAPIGHGYKAIAGIAAALGTSYDALDQFMRKEDIDPVQTLVVGGSAAALAPATVAGARLLGGKYNKWRAERNNKAQVVKADEDINKIQDAMNEAVVSDIPLREMPMFIERATGFNQENVLRAIALSGRKPAVLSQDDAAAAIATKNTGYNPAMRGISKRLDEYIGVVSTRINNISPKVFGRLREYDKDVHIKTQSKLREANSFRKFASNIKGEEAAALNRSLLNGNFESARAILGKQGPEAIEAFDKVVTRLEQDYDELVTAGYTDLGKIENYFPRTVRDLDGLLGAIGSKRSTLIDRALNKRATQLGLKNANELDELERATIINNIIRGYTPKLDGNKLSFTKQRQIEDVTEDLLQYYDNPIDSLYNYITKTTENIERRKFFGQYGKNKGTMTTDIDSSVGALVDAERKALSYQQTQDLKELLVSRFTGADRKMGTIGGAYRDLSYAATIANPYSAMVQAGDLAVSAYAQGLRNSIAALLTKNKVSVEDLGLDNVIAAEFKTGTSTGKLLNKLFRLSGFSAMDRLGKNVNINASLRKGKALASSEKGVNKLKSKYEKAYGTERVENLVSDLKAGKITEDVKLYLWNELADIQPISLSEVPQAYLDAANGRLFYTLKTWSLKQLDVMRRDIAQQYAKGNKLEATKNAVAYAALVPTANMSIDMIRDVLKGREFPSVDEIPDAYVSNIFRMFGASEYVTDKFLSEGKVASGLKEIISPPLVYIDAIGQDIENLVTSGQALPENVLRQLPLIGQIWYNFFGGGIERYYEKKEQKEMREMFGDFEDED